MKPTQGAKKTKGVGKRASKDDLAPRKSQDVKGGSFLGGISKGIKGVVKGATPIVPR
jgi:hypothetical protein